LNEFLICLIQIQTISYTATVCIMLQIVSFLRQNAHPRVAQRVPAVPENVTDQVLSLSSVHVCFLYFDFWYLVLWWWQIRLWESDLNRVEMTEAYYYDEFPSRVSNFDSASSCLTYPLLWLFWFLMSFVWQDVFEGACDCAREWNGLLWEDSKKMLLVVKSEVHTYVRDFLRRQK
jgi:transcription initiation factor TFIIH subunit 4